MTLPGVKSGKTGGAPGRQQPAIGFDGPAQLRNVVAEHFAKAAGLEKIPLHVDDQEGAMRRREREGVRFRRKVYGLAHRSAPGLGQVGRQRLLGEGIEDRDNGRPGSANPVFASDISDPRQPTRRRSTRKDHAYSLARVIRTRRRCKWGAEPFSRCVSMAKSAPSRVAGERRGPVQGQEEVKAP
jgi:hypothetical protein